MKSQIQQQATVLRKGDDSTVNIEKKSQLQHVIECLRESGSKMRSAKFRAALCTVSEEEAETLRNLILSVTAFLDDSVSNPHIGSLFDRMSDDPLNQMSDNIAKAYGVQASYCGTTGTTGLNVPAVMTIAKEGERIAVGRDSHVSVNAGVCLSGAVPCYLVPPFDWNLGVLLPPSPKEVSELLDKNPDVRAVVVTLPNYHGMMGDAAGIVDECHKRGVVVMVDGAHGPHFRFLHGLGFPLAAEEAGADMVSQSTHKVMSALNQGSLLHFNNVNLLSRYEEFQAQGFQSTSFSYPILTSVENAVGQMMLHGESIWKGTINGAAMLRETAARLPGVRALDRSIVDGVRVIGIDPTRVTLNFREVGRTGYDIANGLLRRGIIVEMATHDTILFLVSPSVTEELIVDTVRALREVLDEPAARSAPEILMPPALPKQVLTPRQAAMRTTRERVPVADAIGRVSAETIGCYPPGQAIIVAGEQITKDAVTFLERSLTAGAHLKRIQDDNFKTIEIVASGKGV